MVYEKSLRASIPHIKLPCLITLLFLYVIINGCVATNAFPVVARAGDTITLAVGSADDMSTSNTVVDFYPGTDKSLVSPISIPIRSLMKIYPDKASDAWLNTTAISKRTGHGPHLNVLVLDLPNSLPEGEGIIRVTTNGEPTYPRFSTTPDDVEADIFLEILPGTGNSSLFDYYSYAGAVEAGDLARLEQLPQVIIKPPIPEEGSEEDITYGAVEISVTVPITHILGGEVVDDGIAVFQDDQPQNITNQTNLVWSRSGDDFTIYLTSPIGMFGYQSRVYVVPKFPSFLYEITGTPAINHVKFYDIDGNIVAGPALSLTHLN